MLPLLAHLVVLVVALEDMAAISMDQLEVRAPLAKETQEEMLEATVQVVAAVEESLLQDQIHPLLEVLEVQEDPVMFGIMQQHILLVDKVATPMTTKVLEQMVVQIQEMELVVVQVINLVELEVLV